MAVHLWLAPAAAGKTAYILDLVRSAAQGLQATPRLVVATHLQVRAARRRLAAAGGAIGVRVLTFDRLYAECLNVAGEAYTELSEPVQYRLIRSLVDGLQLRHYAPLTGRPGFIQGLEGLIGELKAARIDPELFTQAVAGLGGEPRLAELAQIYLAYQERLQARRWADRAGLGWLAVEALEQRAPEVGRDWPLLAVDGFDSFTPIQVALLGVLAPRVGEMVITLTGTADGQERPLVHRRFGRTRRELESALGVAACPLPAQEARRAPPLAHLEAGLFRIGQPADGGSVRQVEAAGALELIEAPDRAAEVRAALRWLKARLLADGMALGDVALLARDLPAYRPFILVTAAEFGLPVRLVDGLPLRANPAVAALLDLLRLVLPRAAGDVEPALPRRAVVEAWRSPYFDWSALPENGSQEPIGITAGDAEALDAAARWGRVIGGRCQWDEVLDKLAARAAGTEREAEKVGGDEEQGIPAGVPVGPPAQVLRLRFGRFVQRLTPPAGQQTYRNLVRWLEDLIGSDLDPESSRYPRQEEATALRLVACARDGPEGLDARDLAALRAFKELLRGLVWAEEALETGPAAGYAEFVAELAGAVDAAGYSLPVTSRREELLVADVVQARGLPFRAVAVLGLAEGEFPATLGEDPFLRDADRRRLRAGYGLPLEPSLEGAEIEYFYETVSRPAERLLLTRPRLADNGALWQASPFWEEVGRLVRVEPQALTSETVPPPAEAASWPELMESLAAHGGYGAVRDWVRQVEPDRQAALDHAAQVLHLRASAAGGGALDGDLSSLAADFARRFGPEHTWSATRLESYRSCPFAFFVGAVLGLEPRLDPVEGLDARQLGNIYHRILEGVYRAPEVSDPANLEQLLAALPRTAATVLDAAPEREGFRETAWWAQTREEILGKVCRSLEALARLPGEFVPDRQEESFGAEGQEPLVVQREGDEFRLHGVIDRIDRTVDGRLRLIDYKTAGPTHYTQQAVADGRKLQLPLYALAARDALGLGEPAEGFYWHVRHAEPSSFSLADFPGGSQAVIDAALEKAWEAVRGAREGHFVPHPPADGCPGYCPAVGFCWHCRTGFGG